MSGLGRLYRGETKIDFIGRRKLWFLISGILMLASIVTLATRGLNLGIEFQGGLTVPQVPIAAGSDLASLSDEEAVTRVTDRLEELGTGDQQVQVERSEDERFLIVQTKSVPEATKNRVKAAIEQLTGSEIEDFEEIGSKWGGEITRKAVRALIIFLIVVLVFISWRFEWKMAVAAVAALLHDLLITAGIYSMVGFEVTPSTVIAILTILGYSLYDTVVVFDKVEENTDALAATGKMTYQDSANLAMNQVFMRSLNTSLSSILPVAALLVIGAGLLGAGTLKDLSLALLVGLVAGTYSSVFFATPILAIMKEKEPKYRATREKISRDAQRAASIPPRPVAVAGDGEAIAVTSASPRPTVSSRPSQGRPRAGSKKAARRKKR